ncbi:GNAT family N-acetyltransferase [Pseudothauera rhizosphaerae]|uniref:GNAT family N-acetyltransferase n=1 Tax=Pseudothauera rhizosphaerae TaxID=2565932 RepID=A0A4S4ALI3_9RHOO|nr:GNAT family N-acetyltransferase [Pseudothauera rhizosphaerae]THF60385.1 GNAT family N-acetyltransferase [Pseudothauera rhizosphaerae]
MYRVESSSIREHERRIALRDDNDKTFTIRLHRFALVGKGDAIAIDPEHPRNVFTVSKENPEDLIRVSPAFSDENEARLGARRYKLQFSEILSREDNEDLLYLEQFHYKSLGVDLDVEDRKLSSAGGRRAVLLMHLIDGRSRTPAGYIELQMPLLMVKPRHELFSAGFEHPERPIAWTDWDQNAMRKYVNAIVRIARVVVHPEYRGLGVSRTLIETAKRFATERWQVGGVRPLFMEISAEMLNYIDFVSRAGFVLAGKTEGNLTRIVKDLVSMTKGYEVTSGIMSLQKKYLTHLERYCAETGKDFAAVLKRLEDVTRADDPMSALSPSEWLHLRQVLRFPIPYYIAGLDEPTRGFLKQHVKCGTTPKSKRFSPGNVSISISGLKAVSNYEIPRTNNVRLILNCFGIQATHLNNRVVGPLDIRASSGNIIFIAGASGTGKSVLLRALDPQQWEQTGSLVIEAKSRSRYSASWLRPLPEDIPIFDLFAERHSAAMALSALSNVGLSEAFAFIKPFNLLSRGQRYRAMLADLLLRNDPVWLIDEFCADLDPMSARIVAHNVRKHVSRTGRIAFIAAANHGHFIDALNPTQIIRLRLGGEATAMTFRDYCDEFQTIAS